MGKIKTSPGPAADQAFRLGILASLAAGGVVLGILYWIGLISLPIIGYILLSLLPVYLILVASVLSVWLGYSKDISALRPVYKEKNSKRGE